MRGFNTLNVRISSKFFLDIEDLDLEGIELADTDTCIVSIKTNNSPNLINIKEVEVKRAMCNWCRKEKMCLYTCVCKKVILRLKWFLGLVLH